MQWGRFTVWAAILTFGIGGVAWVADALVESDDERIAEVADAMVSSDPDHRIDAVIAWVDPGRVPVMVRTAGDVSRFGEDDEDPGNAIRDALAPLEASGLQLVQRSVDVNADRATIALRVRNEEGVVDVEVGLRRDGQAWLVSDVRRL